MKRAIFTFVLCAMLTAGVMAKTRLGDCKHENILQIGAINGKTPVVAYCTEDQGLISVDKKYYVEISDRQEGPYDHTDFLTFSPDGKAFAYVAEIDSKRYVIMNGEKAGPYDSAFYLVFSHDGRTFAYRAEIDGKHYIIADGKKAGPYDHVGDQPLVFSPDGKTIAYVIDVGFYRYVVVGKNKEGPYDYAYSLKFSPDGKTLAYNDRKIDGNTLYNYLLVDGTTYIGSLCGGHAVYLKDGAIWTR